MFGFNKLKRQLEEQQNQIEKLREDNRRLEFKINNPPKYIVGDELNEKEVITGSEIVNYGIAGYKRVYLVFNKNLGKTLRLDEESIVER